MVVSGAVLDIAVVNAAAPGGRYPQLAILSVFLERLLRELKDLSRWTACEPIGLAYTEIKGPVQGSMQNLPSCYSLMIFISPFVSPIPLNWPQAAKHSARGSPFLWSTSLDKSNIEHFLRRVQITS